MYSEMMGAHIFHNYSRLGLEHFGLVDSPNTIWSDLLGFSDTSFIVNQL